jgi:acyl carrier protein
LLALPPTPLYNLRPFRGECFSGRRIGGPMSSSTTEIEVKVIEIVSKQLGVAKEKITRQSSFVNDLGADSLDTVELVMEIEDAFDLSIPDEAAEKIQTVGDAIKYIEDHLRDKK